MTHEPLPVERVVHALEAWDVLGGSGHEVTVEPIPPGATADVFLVERGTDRWVAKYAYQQRAYAEAGLAVSEWLDLPDYEIARPIRTTTGDLTSTVEWPPGNEHPLALLGFVEGDTLERTDADAIELRARACGRVHAALLGLDPAQVGIELFVEDGPPQPRAHWDLGDHQWLDDVLTEADRTCIEHRRHVRCGVAVWDGPDIRVRPDGGVGLIDFGHTMWQPIVNVVANRSFVGDYEDLDQLAHFLDAVQQELPLTDTELDAFADFRRLNAATYARWAANQVHEHGAPIGDWLARLVSFLRSGASS